MKSLAPSGPSTATGPVIPIACVIHAMVRGSIGFGAVSLLGFSVWAFGERRFHGRLGEAGLYGACALVFVGSSGLFLHRLMRGPGSLLRFYKLFIPAFLAYAVTWCAAWFTLRFGLGEWLGSLLGTTAFVATTSWLLKSYCGFTKAAIVLFGFHSAGYFLGGQLMHWLTGPAGHTLLAQTNKEELSIITKLSWGLLYGLGFGAGIGYTFHVFQAEGERPNAVNADQRDKTEP